MDINYFDLAIAAIVLLLGLKGLLNGFSKEVFGTVGIVGGIYVASHAGNLIGAFLSDNLFHFESETTINLIGFILALAIFWILMVALGTGFKRLSSLSGLGPLDRVLGFFIGSSKFFLILSIIVYALFSVDALRENFQEKMQGSLFFAPMVETGSFILQIHSEEDLEKLLSQKQETYSEIPLNSEPKTIVVKGTEK